MARLTSLNLSRNDIGAAGAASLAPSLAAMAQLTLLDLGGNYIVAEGAASLAPSLAPMAQLISLNRSTLGRIPSATRERRRWRRASH